MLDDRAVVRVCRANRGHARGTLAGAPGVTVTLVSTLLTVALVALAIYAAFIVALLLAGRRTDARAWAGFIPDCIVFGKRLMQEPTTARSTRLLLMALIAYLALPIDLVPDFIPVVGQLDDAVLVALVLRRILRTAEPDTIERCWPGPARSLALVLRLSGDRP